MFPPFERDELIELRERAESLALYGGSSATWARAYCALADAADHLDAMIARTGDINANFPNVRSTETTQRL